MTEGDDPDADVVWVEATGLPITPEARLAETLAYDAECQALHAARRATRLGSDHDYSEVECDGCRSVQLCRSVPDPFITEIYPERDNPQRCLCDDCYEEREDDI